MDQNAILLRRKKGGNEEEANASALRVSFPEKERKIARVREKGGLVFSAKLQDVADVAEEVRDGEVVGDLDDGRLEACPRHTASICISFSVTTVRFQRDSVTIESSNALERVSL